ncbi:MAG: hydrogenase [Epsilonproteobacteria bacterium]|nr:hydrogenase [Campylobacterota bacterium]NPA57623.1 hydrogenase [Campylobacterota bacterium]
MKILLLCDTFNTLTQKVYCRLRELGHTVSVEYALSPETMEEGVQLFQPDLIIAPYLTKRIPSSIFTRYPTYIIHPGPPGDRGAFSLDLAILQEEEEWGVTLLEADEEFDGGAIVAWRRFPVTRGISKGALYRTTVSQLALELVEELLTQRGEPLPNPRLPLHPKVTQRERAIDWERDSTQTIMKKINASDNFPGVRDRFFDLDLYLFGAVEERDGLEKMEGAPKEIIAKRNGAVLVKTVDGALWIRQMTEIRGGIRQIKLPATYLLKERIKGVKEERIPLYVPPERPTFKEITYYQRDRVGFLAFHFYNGAMASDHCIRLKYAIETLREEVDILVLLGGEQFFSNGIHLTILEESKKKGEDGWSNINAMNDLVKTIIGSEDQLIITAFRGNAGAGGVFLGLAGDIVMARESTILNPHYRTIGLSGSELHTYTLPLRVGQEMAEQLLEEALPISGREAQRIGMVDHLFDRVEEVESFALQLAQDEERYYDLLDAKRERLSRDWELIEELERKELERIYPQFWDPESPFHRLRREFVYKICPRETPRRLAIHRRDHA